jgi:DNA-binding MarR family transcriptional regulator
MQLLYGASIDARLPTVTDAVLLASRALVGVAARSLAAVEEEVTLPQYRALVVLSSGGSRRQGELADALGVHPSTATRLCARLERKGLITRHPAEESRRELIVDLSPAGREIVDTVTRRRRREITKIVARIPRREQRTLVEALSSFADAAGELPEPSWTFGWEQR